MILSFVLVGWIGLKAGAALLSARAQASQESSLISSLKAQHRSLLAREKALHQPATIMRDARSLGMVRAGERSYVIVGLPSH
jgi:cell division protein FtsB